MAFVIYLNSNQNFSKYFSGRVHSTHKEEVSCPLVVSKVRLDALEPPEILGVQVLGFRVSSAETFGNPCVVNALSITKSEVTNPATNCETKEDAGEREHDVSIEGYGV